MAIKWKEIHPMAFKIHSISAQHQGPLLVLLSQFLFSLINTAIRILVTNSSTPLSPVQIVQHRMVITLALSLAYCLYLKVPNFPFGKPEVRGMMILRGLGGTCGATGFYFSLKYLPLAEATVLNLLAPLGSCIVVAIFIKAAFSRLHAIAALLSLTSVVLVVQPSVLFGASHLSSPHAGSKFAIQNHENDGGRALGIGVGFALLGACGGICTYTCIRIIADRVHPLLSVNYFCVIVVTITSIIMMLLSSERPNLHLSWVQIILVCLTGVLSFITEFLLTQGIAMERSSSATQMVLSQVLFATALDWIIWRHVPNLLSATGDIGIVISLGLVLITTSESFGGNLETVSKLKYSRSSTGIQDRTSIDLESIFPDDDEKENTHSPADVVEH